MLTNVFDAQRSLVGNLFASYATLTSVQGTALQTELATDPAGRGYRVSPGGAFQSVAALMSLLNQTYSAAYNSPQNLVPAVPQTIAVTSIPKAVIEQVMLSQYTQVMQLQAATTDPNVKLVCAIFFAKLAAFQNSSLTDVLVDASFEADLTALQNAGILTAAQITALTTVPNPAFSQTVTQPPRAVSLFGKGSYLLPEDVQSAVNAAATVSVAGTTASAATQAASPAAG